LRTLTTAFAAPLSAPFLSCASVIEAGRTSTAAASVAVTSLLMISPLPPWMAAAAILGRLRFPGEGTPMKHIAVAVLLFAVTTACMAQTPPEWAYPVNPPGFKPRADDGTPRRVEGSNASYTLTQ